MSIKVCTVITISGFCGLRVSTAQVTFMTSILYVNLVVLIHFASRYLLVELLIIKY